MKNSTIKSEKDFHAEEWVSQAEAARIRGISQQGIANLLKRGKLKGLKVAGKTLLKRADVEAFVPLPVGRPRKRTLGAGSLKLGAGKKKS